MAEPQAPTRRVWRKLIPALVGTASLSLGAGLAAAADGGGLASPKPPAVRDVQCVERCAGIRDASIGSTIEITGENLDGVDEVIFAGGVGAEPRTASAGAVEAKVPGGAETGTVRASAYGVEAESEQELRIVRESELPEAGSFRLESISATPRKAYVGGRRKPAVSYMFHGGSSVDVRIDVLDKAGSQVSSWVEEDVEPNSIAVAKWNGRTAGGSTAPSGVYRFRVSSLAAAKRESSEAVRFGFYEARFPIKARHSYGDGFGAGRGHQGQDVFARCGKKLFAARGGTVQWNKSHSAAGNYIVIDVKGTDEDFMYAHLREPSPLAKGERVKTGEMIGRVGDTGNASGCHLHFEIWSGPGWYEGGDPLPGVTRILKRWDRWS